jgi:hypothetical protein
MRPCRMGSSSGTRIAFWATIVSRASCPRAVSSQCANAPRGARLRAALPARASLLDGLPEVVHRSCRRRSRALVASRHESRFSRRLRPAAGRYLMETMPLVRRPRCRMHARRWVVNLQKPLALPWQTGVTEANGGQIRVALAYPEAVTPTSEAITVAVGTPRNAASVRLSSARYSIARGRGSIDQHADGREARPISVGLIFFPQRCDTPVGRVG